MQLYIYIVFSLPIYKLMNIQTFHVFGVMKNSNKYECVSMSIVRQCVCVCDMSQFTCGGQRQFCGVGCLLPPSCEFWRLELRMPKLLCQCLYLLSHLIGPCVQFFHGGCNSFFVNIYLPTSLEYYIFRESSLTIWSVQHSFPLPLEV